MPPQAFSTTPKLPPLVLHVLYRFDVGGLENGVVNLINHMAPERFRHAVLALDEVSPSFARRIQRSGVSLHALHKPPGHAVWLYPRVWRLLRDLAPAIVHTRNLAALELQVPAWLAGVPVRIHGEHGRDIGDLDGSNLSYQRVRRLYRPFVHHHVALSRDLRDYLVERVHVPPQRVTQIYNGVDASRFLPAPEGPTPIPGCPFSPQSHWLLGAVGRMQAVKDQVTLARAFVRALELAPGLRHRLRLVLVGEGPLRAECASALAAGGATDLAWLPGERSDIPQVMRGLSCFALPSLAEGVSNTILEAMACGLPVVATDVGANADLVTGGVAGEIVPAGDIEAMAKSIVRLASDAAQAAEMGRAGRRQVEQRFSMTAMVEAYGGLYEHLLATLRASAPGQAARA